MRTRRVLSLTLFVVAALSLSSGVAWADWDEGDPAKWVQRPDLDTGMDVNATWLTDVQGPNGGPPFPFIKTVADDFLCTMTGPITDIHIWGSWLRDDINREAKFRLAIYEDVPKLPGGTNYSHPGELRWSTILQPTSFRKWADAQERFFEPNTGEFLPPGDTIVWQYNFLIDQADAFVQRGEPNIPKVYWLGVEAIVPGNPGIPLYENQLFGWKTSLDKWNDDAVFGDSDDPELHPGLWRELIDPSGVSLDMAFAITTIPEPSTWLLATLALLGGAFIARRYRVRGAA